uniref:Cathepsin H n=1 Tax=Callorhinchus milii TaxID=7868 RepID=A0A4W3JNQ3_CALMI
MFVPLSLSEIVSFKTWMTQHNKHYSSEEYSYRLRTFIQNKRKVEEHNSGQHSYRMGLNQFSDMTFSEFKKLYLLREPQNCSATRGNHVLSMGPYPDFVDWRTKGNYVTPVKNQGGCGSCWTFSTTGCLESAIAIKTGKLLSLAEQQLVDCAGYDENGIVDAVARLNPVSIAFEVTDDFFQYEGGVYSNSNCDSTPDKVNHAVLAVGYGVQNGTKYWIVKNSWGPEWGLNGYFYIIRGKNMCGLAACPSYPIPLL